MLACVGRLEDPVQQNQVAGFAWHVMRIEQIENGGALRYADTRFIACVACWQVDAE